MPKQSPSLQNRCKEDGGMVSFPFLMKATRTSAIARIGESKILAGRPCGVAPCMCP